MAGEAGEIALSKQDLREVTAFAAACAEVVLEIFEADQPDDSRQPRARTLRLRARQLGQRCLRQAPPTCIPWPMPPRSNTFSEQALTRPEQPNSLATTRLSVPNTLNKRCIVRHWSSLTCSNASQRHQVAVDGLVN